MTIYILWKKSKIEINKNVCSIQIYCYQECWDSIYKHTSCINCTYAFGLCLFSVSKQITVLSLNGDICGMEILINIYVWICVQCSATIDGVTESKGEYIPWKSVCLGILWIALYVINLPISNCWIPLKSKSI